jgi:hypothetical protein
VTLRQLFPLGLILLCPGCQTSSSPAGVDGGGSAVVTGADGGSAVTFKGDLILGSPTTTSIRASVFSSDQSGTISLQYGTSSGAYDRQTPVATLTAGVPLVLAVEGLAADEQYYYRVQFQGVDGGTTAGATAESRFHTARPPGSSFTFTVQADSHLDGNSSLDVYRRTLGNVLADMPDFHLDLGDTFMCEKYSAPLTAVAQAAPDEPTVISRYRYERENFGLVAHSVPLFLVNGNHDGELGFLVRGAGDDLATWATQARQRYYPNPTPDAFYSGDLLAEPFVGERAAWYAWQWGDALFVVLDPFWSTKSRSNADGWVWTLGQRQYDWLVQTLSSTTARFKFVFLHNLVGGLDGQMRGGVEAAPFFEWGGNDADGSPGFAQHRPGWRKPIHQLLVDAGVTVVFHGHDHLYAHQVLDGVVYQEVPQPSAVNSSSGPSLAAAYHYASGMILSSAGHLRVKVTPGAVTGEYVRAWLPASENSTRRNGEVAHSWVIPAR